MNPRKANSVIYREKTAAWRLSGGHYHSDSAKVRLLLDAGEDSRALLVAADGIHSAVRAQMWPYEGPPIWNGAILWRGAAQATPFLTGASMIIAGHDSQRLVAYPLSRADRRTGLAEINWIAERRFDPSTPWRKEDWNRATDSSAFLPWFQDWVFGWLDVPALIRAADRIYEYPMVDRDPSSGWSDGRVILIWDAAQAMYPVGSNGAGQAILDARALGAKLLEHGLNSAAIKAF